MRHPHRGPSSILTLPHRACGPPPRRRLPSSRPAPWASPTPTPRRHRPSLPAAGTEGIYVRQQRQKPQDCPNTDQIGKCLPELQRGAASRRTFGKNWTDPEQPPIHPWEFFNTEELGSDPDGVVSAAVASMREYDTDGFIALAIPFFSTDFLLPQEGATHEVSAWLAALAEAEAVASMEAAEASRPPRALHTAHPDPRTARQTPLTLHPTPHTPRSSTSVTTK